MAIDSGLLIIAEQGNRVSFDETAIAHRSWLIIDAEPEKRQGADISADADFKGSLGRAQLLARHAELGSSVSLVRLHPPTLDMAQSITLFQRGSDQRPKNRSA